MVQSTRIGAIFAARSLGDPVGEGACVALGAPSDRGPAETTRLAGETGLAVFTAAAAGARAGAGARDARFAGFSVGSRAVPEEGALVAPAAFAGVGALTGLLAAALRAGALDVEVFVSFDPARVDAAFAATAFVGADFAAVASGVEFFFFDAGGMLTPSFGNSRHGRWSGGLRGIFACAKRGGQFARSCSSRVCGTDGRFRGTARLAEPRPAR